MMVAFYGWSLAVFWIIVPRLSSLRQKCSRKASHWMASRQSRRLDSLRHDHRCLSRRYRWTVRSRAPDLLVLETNRDSDEPFAQAGRTPLLR
jgi:hypothetical protein